MKINLDWGRVFWKYENTELYAIVKDFSNISKHRQNGKMTSKFCYGQSFTIACHRWVTVHFVLLVYVKLLFFSGVELFSLPSLINSLLSRCFHHQHTLDVWQRLEKKVKVIKIFIYKHTSLTFHVCNIKLLHSYWNQKIFEYFTWLLFLFLDLYYWWQAHNIKIDYQKVYSFWTKQLHVYRHLQTDLHKISIQVQNTSTFFTRQLSSYEHKHTLLVFILLWYSN